MMELTINLKHDVVHYDESKREGVLKSEVFGCTKFSIGQFGEAFEIEFIFEGATLDTVWTYNCYFTDHDTLLHVKF